MLLFLIAAVIASVATQANAPVQPIPFSHKQHAETARMKCADCHKLSESGEIEMFPKPKTCMTCHATVKADSSDIRMLKDYADARRPIPWVRVYELPGFVYFSHKVHLDSGASCQSCHGPVAQRGRLWRETDLSMQACIDCHKNNRAAVGCGTCHELQQ